MTTLENPSIPSHNHLKNIGMKKMKKPPIYLPELRDRKDIWGGKSSVDLLVPNQSSKKMFLYLGETFPREEIKKTSQKGK